MSLQGLRQSQDGYHFLTTPQLISYNFRRHQDGYYHGGVDWATSPHVCVHPLGNYGSNIVCDSNPLRKPNGENVAG